MNPSSHPASLLQSADIVIDVHAPLASTLLRQRFVNRSSNIIEAVYSFPLPRQAVISKVTVTINDQVFVGQIQTANQAELIYEDGIESAKRSIIIRDLGDGLYELRAGNLAPQDCLEVKMQIAQLMISQAGAYRYFLPTVIAPKYGKTVSDAAISHQHSMLANYPFKAKLVLAHEAQVNCLSHDLTSIQDGYTFAGVMDEDIVLSFGTISSAPFVLPALEGDFPCSLSVVPPSTNKQEPVAASLVLLIDCSGSMAGLSMEQTRTGLLACIEALPNGSEISLLCFGSSVLHTSTQPLMLNPQNRKALHLFINNMQADMGGTEIWGAIAQAQIQGKQHKNPPEIVLLTDGQVWSEGDIHAVLHATQKEIFCVHTVGVGSAVSDDVVIQIAESTGGEWMLVHPNEPMGLKLGQFIGQVSTAKTPCLWDAGNNVWSALPVASSVTHGAVGYAVYGPASEHVNVSLNNKVLPQHQLSASFSQALQKLVGQKYVYSLAAKDAANLSQKLGLINRYTSFVMVSEEALENADGLPKLVVVPQMDTSLGFLDIPASLSMRRERVVRSFEPDLCREDEMTVDAKTNSSKVATTKPISQAELEKNLLLNVEKKMKRLLFRSRVPSITMLLKWGLNSALYRAANEYLAQHRVTIPQCYIAKLLLWLNGSHGVLSSKSVGILQTCIDDEYVGDVSALDKFIGELEEVKAAA